MWWMLASALANPCPQTSTPAADTTHGCLLGVRDGGFEAFLGVPYAQAPVGDLRWERPQPMAPWGRYRANRIKPVCPQSNGTIGGELAAGEGDEDCLYLNIIRPSGTQPGDDLPVLFFTHGGGHVDGSGTQQIYIDHPELVTQHDVILVTYNYRLAQLGWLAHPALSAADADGVSGNQGLRDSIAALRWVHDNVQAIGGDADRLMIFGESAGSLSTGMMLTTPETQGLFTSATLMSGPAATALPVLRGPRPNPLLHPERGEEQGRRLAVEVGCEDADVEVELACLRSKTTAELMAVMQAREGILGDGETYGGVHDGVLLPLQPVDALGTGQFHRVQLTAGVTQDEGTLFTFGYPTDWATLDQTIRLYAFSYGVDGAGLSALFDASRYTDAREAYAAFVGDVIFVCPTRAMLRTVAPYTETRGYLFDRTPGWFGLLGSFHGGELTYMFGTNPPLAGPVDRRISDTAQAAWSWLARGARNGPWPTFDDGAVPGGTWAYIGETPGVITDVRSEVCGFLEAEGFDPFQ